MDFYSKWLNSWDEEREEIAKARKVIHEDELVWVRTRQDYRAALLCSRENGFFTPGDAILAEIPQGWHTGKHSHGEEAIHIVEGQGFSVIDDRRYDWEAGSCLFIPFGAVNQHFNTGNGKVRYLSAMAVTLERFAGFAKIVQYEDAGETPMHVIEGFTKAESDIHPEYGRIVLRLNEAPSHSAKEWGDTQAKATDDLYQTAAKEMRTPGVPGHRSRQVRFMGWPDTGFKATEVEISAILCDEPGKHGGKHSHMEALLYVLQGEGYSVVDEEKIEWKKGSLIHVSGPQTVHQHFNTGQLEAQQLRFHYGLRAKFFQRVAMRVFPYLYYEYSSYGSGE